MITRRTKGFRAIAVFLAFALAQISLQFTSAAPSASAIATLPPQGIVAKVTTSNNQPIFINGISSPSGSSLATGAIIETQGTGATIDLGVLGQIDLHPNTKVKIEFECPPDKQNDPDPDDCKVKVTVYAGCVVASYKKGTRHQIDTEDQEKIRESDKEKEKQGGGVLNYCKDVVPTAVFGGLGWPGVIAILAGALIIPPTLVTVFDEGGNPSEVVP